MKELKFKKQILPFFFALLMVLSVTVGCEMTDADSVDSDDVIAMDADDDFDNLAATAAVTDPAAKGSFTKCSYTSGLTSTSYLAAMVIYPCEKTQAKYPATTLTGGYTNVYTDMAWLYDHLVTHGYIIIAMTPNNIYGVNSSWQTAHKAGIAKLKSENTRTASPIYGRVNTSKLQIMGFSKGGGGALLASKDLGSGIQSTQALAPYMDFTYNISGIKSPTICYTGTQDTIASPSAVKTMFTKLPTSIKRTFAYFNYVSHLDWMGSSGSYRDRMKTYITSWMKVYLDGNTGYNTYLAGTQSGWFYEFIAY